VFATLRRTALLAANTPKNLQFFGDPNGSGSLRDSVAFAV